MNKVQDVVEEISKWNQVTGERVQSLQKIEHY